jgi:hypothetical protein
VSSVCKIIAIVALMLHSTFGCSLHHAGACCTHSADTARNHDSDGCCGHEVAVESQKDHKGCGHDHNNDTSVFLDEPLCCCDHAPCEERDGGCHSEVECSFLPSSPCSFSLAVAPAAFESVSPGQTLRLNGLTPLAIAEHVMLPTSTSLSRCALLCTWQI